MVNMLDSGRIIVRDMGGDLTNFDTDAIPFISRIYNETLSIISRNSTLARYILLVYCAYKNRL
jgi:hypothetical protein